MESHSNAQDKPFDRSVRRIRRDRAAAQWSQHSFLQTHMVEELIDRLQGVQRKFARALILGFAGDALGSALMAMQIESVTVDSSMRLARTDNGVQCDEDRLPFADASFDLVIAAGTLDTVNDLPGALRLIRQCLRPDGLFLSAFLGSGSLPRLRQSMFEADMLNDSVAPRIHPQIDLRSAGDLLGRAGFALQVADGETLQVRYPNLSKLVADLRGSANSNLLKTPSLSRAALATAHASFESHQIEGKTTELFEIIYLTGWVPEPNQPKPAARGSGTKSLADALKPRN